MLAVERPGRVDEPRGLGELRRYAIELQHASFRVAHSCPVASPLEVRVTSAEILAVSDGERGDPRALAESGHLFGAPRARPALEDVVEESSVLDARRVGR